jgi:hypothetical protein
VPALEQQHRALVRVDARPVVAGEDADDLDRVVAAGATDAAPGIMPSRPLPAGNRINVRSGCTASPAASRRSAASTTAMHSAIGSNSRTSRADRISRDMQTAWSRAGVPATTTRCLDAELAAARLAPQQAISAT